MPRLALRRLLALTLAALLASPAITVADRSSPATRALRKLRGLRAAVKRDAYLIDIVKQTEADRARTIDSVGDVTAERLAERAGWIPLGIDPELRKVTVATVMQKINRRSAALAEQIDDEPQRAAWDVVFVGGGVHTAITAGTLANLDRDGPPPRMLTIEASDRLGGTFRQLGATVARNSANRAFRKGANVVRGFGDKNPSEGPWGDPSLDGQESPELGLLADTATVNLFASGTDFLMKTRAAGVEFRDEVDGGDEWPARYRIRLRGADGRERFVYANAVVEATGLGRPVLRGVDTATTALVEQQRATIDFDEPDRVPDVMYVTDALRLADLSKRGRDPYRAPAEPSPRFETIEQLRVKTSAPTQLVVRTGNGAMTLDLSEVAAIDARGDRFVVTRRGASSSARPQTIDATSVAAEVDNQEVVLRRGQSLADLVGRLRSLTVDGEPLRVTTKTTTTKVRVAAGSAPAAAVAPPDDAMRPIDRLRGAFATYASGEERLFLDVAGRTRDIDVFADDVDFQRVNGDESRVAVTFNGTTFQFGGRFTLLTRRRDGSAGTTTDFEAADFARRFIDAPAVEAAPSIAEAEARRTTGAGRPIDRLRAGFAAYDSDDEQLILRVKGTDGDYEIDLFEDDVDFVPLGPGSDRFAVTVNGKQFISRAEPISARTSPSALRPFVFFRKFRDGGRSFAFPRGTEGIDLVPGTGNITFTAAEFRSRFIAAPDGEARLPGFTAEASLPAGQAQRRPKPVERLRLALAAFPRRDGDRYILRIEGLPDIDLSDLKTELAIDGSRLQVTTRSPSGDERRTFVSGANPPIRIVRRNNDRDVGFLRRVGIPAGDGPLSGYEFRPGPEVATFALPDFGARFGVPLASGAKPRPRAVADDDTPSDSRPAGRQPPPRPVIAVIGGRDSGRTFLEWLYGQAPKAAYTGNGKIDTAQRGDVGDVEWFVGERGPSDCDSFLKQTRSRYLKLAGKIREVEDGSRPRAKLRRTRVTSVTQRADGRYDVRDSSGETIVADKVIFATGFQRVGVIEGEFDPVKGTVENLSGERVIATKLRGKDVFRVGPANPDDTIGNDERFSTDENAGSIYAFAPRDRRLAETALARIVRTPIGLTARVAARVKIPARVETASLGDVVGRRLLETPLSRVVLRAELNDVLGQVALETPERRASYTVAAEGGVLSLNGDGASQLAPLMAKSPLLVDQLRAATAAGNEVTFSFAIRNARARRSTLTISE